MSVVEWRDGHGHPHWQPMLDDGKRLWRDSSYASYPAETTTWRSAQTTLGPVTYRSRARAERVARREHKRRTKKRLSVIREIREAGK